MKYTFDHVHLINTDPAKIAAFYEKTFGFGIMKESSFTLPDGRQLISLNMGGPTIKISNARPKALTPSKETLEHFGLRTDNLVKALEELKKAGVKVVQDVTQVNPKTKVAFVVTPDNVLIEMMEVKA